LPVTGIVSGGLLGLLTLGAAVWMGTRTGRSMSDVIHDVDAEPTPIPAAPAHVVAPVSKTIL
jgi:hypothetical protein